MGNFSNKIYRNIHHNLENQEKMNNPPQEKLCTNRKILINGKIQNYFESPRYKNKYKTDVDTRHNNLAVANVPDSFNSSHHSQYLEFENSSPSSPSINSHSNMNFDKFALTDLQDNDIDNSSDYKQIHEKSGLDKTQMVKIRKIS